jgi:hypothetical protein
MAAARRPPPDLPPDASAQVARLPPWLQDVAAEAFVAVDEAGARNAVKEREEAERTRNFMALVDEAHQAIAGSWGKEVKAAAERLLGNADPRKAEVATLVLIQSVVREEKIRRRKARHHQPAGRGAK